MSEKLYNGITLKNKWPPSDIDDGSLEPIAIPYLANPPEIITIDLGRQLFIDDFLIESTTLKRYFGKPVIDPASPILFPETKEELDNGNCPMAAPFNDGVWYDPSDKTFKMWYMPGWMHTTALALSSDGIRWKRPNLNITPGTNLVWPAKKGYERDGCLVWLDHEATNAMHSYKMFQFYRYPRSCEQGWLHTSPDGIHWSKPRLTTPTGDNTSFFYNPFRRKWVMSIRRWARANGRRSRYYFESDDFFKMGRWNPEAQELNWQRADRLDKPDFLHPEHKTALYDLNATPYESIMLGMFAIFRGPENEACAAEGIPKKIDLELGYSRDGFHFSRPDRTPFLASTRKPGDWNRAYLHAAGGICLVVGDLLYFYFTGFSGISPKLGPNEKGKPGNHRWKMYAGASTGLAILRRDGFAAMCADLKKGKLTTRHLRFKGDRLFVNIGTPLGELKVSVLDINNKPVKGLTENECIPVSMDSTCIEIKWKSGLTLAAIAGKPVKFRFNLTNGNLYSFWVTDNPEGASYGYMAAGGPGLRKGRDLPQTTRS